MEKEITSSSAKKREKSRSIDGVSLMEKLKPKTKELNSWDCSSPTGNGKTSKKKMSDWDSSSECQETMVEPFDSNNDCSKDNDNWDSDSKKTSPGKNEEDEKEKALFSSDSNPLDFSIGDLSDIEKSSLILGSEKEAEEDLLIEDLEEFPKSAKNVTPKQPEKKKPEVLENTHFSDIDSKSEKVRSNRSGTPEDTTVWMIPKSERTQSADSTSRLVSDREKIEKLQFTKKSKSLSNVQKTTNKRRSSRTTRSDYLGSDKSLLQCEGSSLQKNLKNLKDGISGYEGFDRTGVFFTEYECRSMTMQKDLSDKPSESSRNNTCETEEAVSELLPNENMNRGLEQNTNSSTSATMYDRPGTSVDSDVMSMPDIYGKKSLRQRRVENHGMVSPNCRQAGGTSRIHPDVDLQSETESWFLLENTGQYQEISRNEVSILMNGRSADDVLQGKKEHMIPKLKISDPESLKQSLSYILTRESLQYFLKQEDVGGEDSTRKLDLERKVENTLLYIQPGMNQTASIRIIPVEREMVHIWRSARDTGSHLSSEADILLSPQESIAVVPMSPSSHHQGLNERKMSEQSAPRSMKRTEFQSANSHSYTFNPPEFSRLLLETREIVDNLTKNFKILQTKLDGETHRSLVLQNEVNKMKVLLKTSGSKLAEISSKDLMFDNSANFSSSLLTIRTADKVDLRNESVVEEHCQDNVTDGTVNENDAQIVPRETQKTSNQVSERQNGEPEEGNNIITVNIYTVEDNPIALVPMPVSVHDSNSMVQSNLNLVEERIKRLQTENESLTSQNETLRQKLKEISMELERYLSDTPEQDQNADDTEALRNQVCNLKLELENLKNLEGREKANQVEENLLIREQLKKSLLSLKEWSSAASEISENLNTAKNRLKEIEINLDERVEPETVLNPRTFSKLINVYITQTTQKLLEYSLFEEIRKKDSWKQPVEFQELNQVTSDYKGFMEESKKGETRGKAENKFLEDYFAIIMEKAALVEEVKLLKTENEILLETQKQNHEKLKQTMITLKNQKSDIEALESTQKLSEEERSKMTGVLKLNKEEMENLKKEISKRNKAIDELLEEMKEKDTEMDARDERLKAAVTEINNLERTCRLKDEFINKLKTENDELSAEEGSKDNQIRILKDEIKILEGHATELESELSSSKIFLNQSQKEMTEYVTHLETIINNTQESLDKTKQRLKESNQTISRLKSDIDVLEKQHQVDVKLFNQTKDELETVKEKLTKAEERAEEAELQQKEMSHKTETIRKSEREKAEALENLSRDYEALVGESANMKKKLALLTKDKDETLKDQKDLINKYAMLSKEVQRLQDKYKSVKTECNERTNLIRYLEMMLKENLIEYSSRIGYLEENISRLVEKIAACKNGMRDKHSGGDVEVRELRYQLKVTYQERQELENIVNNYYSLMKHLEDEIQARENRVDELHLKLLEHQKSGNSENSEKCSDAKKSLEGLTIEKLENQITIAQNELVECKKELQQCHTNYENEKKKMELAITDLKSEVNRYRVRIEVMMRNISNKSLNGPNIEKSAQVLKKELEEKDKKITELTDLTNRYILEMSTKDADLENFKKKTACMEEELKSTQSRIAKLQDALSASNKTNEIQQKEKDEMAEKLLQSIKLIMEEKSTRQTMGTLAAEKEKNMKNQIDQIKNELHLKVKECDSLSDALEDKKSIINKLQDDLKKIKYELKSHKRKTCLKGSGDGCHNELCMDVRPSSPNVLSERLEKCLRDLKEVRDVNLQLRKAEGQYQAKIVRLEDEIRDSRLLIKELQGDIKTEKKSKRALKNMIMAAKMEIEKCLLAKQIMSVVADRIIRHLDLAEIPSRELLSGFRLSDSGSTN